MPPSQTRPESFTDIQYAFTRHIRDPENQPAPADVEDRRMAIYRDLFYRNVESFLANSFPVLKKIIPDEQWHDMIRDYFSRHRARTPLFPKMPTEFLQYLEHERSGHSDDYPFLLELAHYEWLEVELSLDTRDISEEGIATGADLLAGIPVLSALIRPVVYQFPVHNISLDYLPESAAEQPTYLVVFRKRNDEIGFLELNSVAARLLELLQQQSDRTGKELLLQIAAELQHPDPVAVIKGGLEIMQGMHEKDIILGTKIID